VDGRERARAPARRCAPDEAARLHDGIDGHDLGPASPVRHHQPRGAGRPADDLRLRDRGPGRRPATLRFVHSGFLPGDDWEQEYEALKVGDPAYVAKLAEYVEHFAGRRAVPISLWGPQVSSERAWAVFTEAAGVAAEPVVGEPAHFRAEGLPDLDGEIDYVSPHFLGIRTADGMYRFIHGMGTVAIGHHIYQPVDRAATERAWQAWLDRTFA
jgi:hypothetical protein